MLTIGFATSFYTLWTVERTQEQYPGHEREVIAYTYHQNLALSQAGALAAVAARFPNQPVAVDLSLRATRSFRQIGDWQENYPDWVFPFGRSEGQDMRESTDLYHLALQARQGKNEARCTWATERLLALGEWTHFEGEVMSVACRQQLLSQRQYQAQFHGVHGERITIEAHLICCFSEQSRYGEQHTQLFQTPAGQCYAYVGATPPAVEFGPLYTLTGTIKHAASELTGNPETRLLRVKISG